MRITAHTLLEVFHGFFVLAEGHVGMTSSEICLDEALITAKGFVSVLDGLIPLGELEVDEGPVAIACGVGRVYFDRPVVALKGVGVVSLGVELVTSHAVNVAGVFALLLLS